MEDLDPIKIAKRDHVEQSQPEIDKDTILPDKQISGKQKTQPDKN